MKKQNAKGKITATFSIGEDLLYKFRQTADKDGRKMSQVVESYIRQYVELIESKDSSLNLPVLKNPNTEF
jgi:hypothetical protein